MIEVSNLQKEYGTQQVLKGVNFRLGAGDQCVIQGASGSGKSTFLYIVGGLETFAIGEVNVGGVDLKHSSDDQLAVFRNQQVGFIFQFHFLLPSMTVMDNILLPKRIQGKAPSQELMQRVQELADFLQVEHCLEKYPFQLSGGEQQRVNIIRAVCMNPKLILCDEPTGNLDSHNTDLVVQLLKQVSAELGLALIVVTHDMEVARHFQAQYLMEDGLLSAH